MIVVDANILIYAVNADSPQHLQARGWLEESLSGSINLGLSWMTALAFLRITTRPGVFQFPLEPREALTYVDSWLEAPPVILLSPGDKHWQILRRLLSVTGMAGNLTSDAYLAALALERDATIASADSDFQRFPGLRYVNPLA